MAFKIKHDCAVDIRGATTTTTLGTNGSIVLTDGTKTTTLNADGLNGKVYYQDQSLVVGTQYLPIVQATGSGYYNPVFDTLFSYNPGNNLLATSSIELTQSMTAILATGANSFSGKVLTIDANSQTFREFQFPISDDMTGFEINNRLTNGVYKIYISNDASVVGATSRTISSTLTGLLTNKTSFSDATIAVGDTWVLTVLVARFGTTAVYHNCISLKRYSS
jgi:hypothetical protein